VPAALFASDAEILETTLDVERRVEREAEVLLVAGGRTEGRPSRTEATG
jgi:hypothetical protein